MNIKERFYQIASVNMKNKCSPTELEDFAETLVNELIEKVEKLTIERCASFVDDSCTYGDTHILVKAVRALPVGQIKLEELK